MEFGNDLNISSLEYIKIIVDIGRNGLRDLSWENYCHSWAFGTAKLIPIILFY